MSRLLLIIVLVVSLAWSFFAGYQLLDTKENPYHPKLFFCAQDEAVLLVNRLKEMKQTPRLETFKQNSLLPSILSVDWKSLTGNAVIYLSKTRPRAIIALDKTWRKSDIANIQRYFNQNNIFIAAEKEFLAISIGDFSCPSGEAAIPFEALDKKASANLWEYKGNWKRTDIYALTSGYTEYTSSIGRLTYGKAVPDIAIFATVLPSNIENYEFQERFFAKEHDSILKESPLFEWMDKGFVFSTYKGASFIVTDYQAQQVPSLILLEKAELEDSVFLDKTIKSFVGFQLTSNFPQVPKSRIYLLELENLCIITDKKEVAENLLLQYSLGETLALNEAKSNQFFKGLPTKSNYRFVNFEEKRAITVKNNFNFEVATMPPGENVEINSSTNWTYNTGFNKVAGLVAVNDPLRSSQGVFVYDEEGKYAFVNAAGTLLWGGNLAAPIIHPPQVIDVFENKESQLLFSTNEEVFLLDLNGKNIGSFPYRSENRITSELSTLKWKNTIRILFGTEKGEITMLGNSGKELNIIQVGNAPIKHAPKALNLTGNLRVWVCNTNNEKYLGYLETPAKAELLGKTNASHFIKQGSTVLGFTQENKEIFVESMRNETTSPFAKGKILAVSNDNLLVQNEHEVLYMDVQRNILATQKVPFKEVGAVEINHLGNNKFITVLDYLDNSIYCYLPSGDLMKGFPKEGKGLIATAINKAQKTIQVSTVLNGIVVTYSTPLFYEN